MKRKLLPLVILSSGLLVGLVGCGEEPVVPPTPEEEEENLHPYSFAPTAIDVSKKKISLGVGEETSFITRISPVIAYDAGLVYSSDNEAVATIDAEGKITGVAVGNANITVKYDKDNRISTSIPVSVFTRIGGKSQELTDAVAAMLEVQKGLDEIDTVHMAEYRDFGVYKNGVKTYGTIEYTHTYESKSNAFFYYGWHEETMKVAGGNFEPSDGAWIINTDKGFDTHLYHISGNTKTSLVVPTQSYMDKGTRIDCVKKLLSTLFSGADELFYTAYEDVLSTEDLDEDFSNFRNFITGGYIGDGVVGYTLIQNGVKETMDAEDEKDYHIPANTEVTLGITLHCTWKNGLVTTKEIIQRFDYVLDGEPCYLEWKIHDSFETTGFNLPYPVESEYRQVDTIFDV